jgi:hypothetical protein
MTAIPGLLTILIILVMGWWVGEADDAREFFIRLSLTLWLGAVVGVIAFVLLYFWSVS